jgi:lipoprotein-anchoring transpeptidase ErfK/SrfK
MRAWLSVAALAAFLTGCAGWDVGEEGLGALGARRPPSPERVAEPVPESPAEAAPGPRGNAQAWRAALEASGERIVVSRDARQLWLMRGDSVVLIAPVAVGRDTIFRYGGQEWDFNTPTGRMRVLGKEETPVWVPPNWHYYEKAVERGLEPVHLRSGQRVTLSDSTVIEVRRKEVGRVNRYGNWTAFTPGGEIIFDGKIFVPPIGSPQRRIPDVLGTHRLILGDGYLIHGTPEEDSIGEWASHGCVRMLNSDVERLYGSVKVGTPVYVY